MSLSARYNLTVFKIKSGCPLNRQWVAVSCASQSVRYYSIAVDAT
jgi:hypothetical protein